MIDMEMADALIQDLKARCEPEQAEFIQQLIDVNKRLEAGVCELTKVFSQIGNTACDGIIMVDVNTYNNLVNIINKTNHAIQ